MTPAAPIEYRRAGWLTAIVVLITLVGDGFSGRPNGLTHQLIVLPVTVLFVVLTFRLLFSSASPDLEGQRVWWTPRRALQLAFAFQVLFSGLFLYECRHFFAMGYRLHPMAAMLVFAPTFVFLGGLAFGRNLRGVWIFAIAIVTYVAGLLLSIGSFPLNYLRSDMLPVIVWADTNLLHHISPYQQMQVGNRLYDFPYLPGMLVVYLPVVSTHVDIRFASLLYVVASAVLIFAAARSDRRREVAALLAIFLLCPFLQFRHELYNQPHWCSLVVIFFLMQRRRFAWAAFAFGISMGIYQFSWILLPFFLLNAFHRKGWWESAKLLGIAALGSFAIAGPFLRSAWPHLASNTVGQWGRRPRADAAPMNLSYWATYIIHPNQLLELQAVLMVAIFAWCCLARRCETFVDTLRWMLVALTVFILFNVLVDGYFYLMLLVPMLIFTCVANGWWADPPQPVPGGG